MTNNAREGRTAIQVISTGGLYGAERALLELAAYLQHRGWRSHVVALEGRGARPVVERARSMGLTAEAFAHDRLGLRAMIRRLRDILSEFPAGVVHSHGYKPDILLALPTVAPGWVRLSTCHTWYRETWKMRTWERLDKWVLGSFDGVVAVSGHIEQELREAGVRADRLRKIDNGIEASARDPVLGAAIRREFRIAQDAGLVVQIGRLARSKRNDLLLDAIAKLPSHVHVIFVGDGEERAALDRRIDDLGLGARVRFAGYRSDVLAFLSAADALAISSDHEGLPIVLLEAMAAGCPVVSTRVGEIGNVLAGERDAWLIRKGDAGELAAALGQVFANPAEAATRAAVARRHFERQHSREAMGEKYLELYEVAWRRRHS